MEEQNDESKTIAKYEPPFIADFDELHVKNMEVKLHNPKVHKTYIVYKRY